MSLAYLHRAAIYVSWLTWAYTCLMTTVDFVRQFPLQEFNKGDILLRDGDVSETLLAVRNGFIKVTSVDEAGNARLIWIAGRYDIVPTEHLFLRRKPLDFFYTALTDGAAYCLDKPTFMEHAKNNLTLMTDIAVAMSNHYDDLLARINSIEQVSVRDKLLSTLCYLGERFGSDDVVDLYQIGLRLTQKDLAAMINSTRETTSLEMHKLRQGGCVEYGPTTFAINVPACRSGLVR
jgi:CRP-like cAMP-binding protein